QPTKASSRRALLSPRCRRILRPSSGRILDRRWFVTAGYGACHGNFPAMLVWEQAVRPEKLRLRAGICEPLKLPRHGAVDLAPERHHEIGDAVEPLPAPLVEFRRLAVALTQ